MEKRTSKIIVGKAGGTAAKGAKTYKIALPSAWIKGMGIDEANRDVELTFDGKNIYLSKKQSVDEFIKARNNSDLLCLKYFNFDKLCTKIIVDNKSKEFVYENYTDSPLETAFGNNENPTWNDFQNFLCERCVPKERDGIKEYLQALGLDAYDPLEIIKITKGKMAEDNQWIEVSECQ